MISVVIPTKNGGVDLVRCLEAISRQQIEEEVEVLVVDSGSEDGSADRARSGGRTCARDPAGGVQPRRSADARRPRCPWRDTGLHDAGRLRRGRALACPSRRAARRRAGRRRLRQTAPARRGEPVRALLPRLPLRAGAQTTAACRPVATELPFDAVLERERGHETGRARAVPARRRRPDERGPGVVAARPPRRARNRLRAAGRRAPLARLHHRGGIPPVLRLRRVRRSGVRERGARVTRRTPAHGRSLRLRRGRMALAHAPAPLAALRGGLRVGEVRRSPAWAAPRADPGGVEAEDELAARVVGEDRIGATDRRTRAAPGSASA